MKFISHRGYTQGNIGPENDPKTIEHLVGMCIHVEIDIRYHCGKLYLGHDRPQEEFNTKWMKDSDIIPYLFIHCKDIESFQELNNIQSNVLTGNYGFLNYFYHTDEEVVRTSAGYNWWYPGIIPAKPTKYDVIVLPNEIPRGWPGSVCCDNINQVLYA